LGDTLFQNLHDYVELKLEGLILIFSEDSKFALNSLCTTRFCFRIRILNYVVRKAHHLFGGS
jgi:hypothetical protein